MAIPKPLIQKHKALGEWSILTGWRGSIAHGMYVPNTDPSSVDDKDVLTVCVPPLEYYFGLKEYGHRGTETIKEGEWDIVAYEARKFIHLLAKGNPNVLLLLWLEPNHYLHRTPAGNLLIENRELFVGKHVYRSFTGYAYGQLHRMTHMACEGYMGEKRKSLVQKHGYDTKNAAHLLRLLRMGIEFLADGKLYVKREDAQELLAVKRGEWTLEKVKAEAERLFEQARDALIASKLPLEPKMNGINKLAVRVVQIALEEPCEPTSPATTT